MTPVVALLPRAWHQGLAQEAASALIEQAFALGWPRVRASTDTPNTSSIALMERLGMRQTHTAAGPFGATLCYELEREPT